ncbi:hypothetical protein DIPPA_62665, partial [Diplonema papillatum]
MERRSSPYTNRLPTDNELLSMEQYVTSRQRPLVSDIRAYRISSSQEGRLAASLGSGNVSFLLPNRSKSAPQLRRANQGVLPLGKATHKAMPEVANDRKVRPTHGKPGRTGYMFSWLQEGSNHAAHDKEPSPGQRSLVPISAKQSFENRRIARSLPPTLHTQGTSGCDPQDPQAIPTSQSVEGKQESSDDEGRPIIKVPSYLQTTETSRRKTIPKQRPSLASGDPENKEEFLGVQQERTPGAPIACSKGELEAAGREAEDNDISSDVSHDSPPITVKRVSSYRAPTCSSSLKVAKASSRASSMTKRPSLLANNDFLAVGAELLPASSDASVLNRSREQPALTTKLQGNAKYEHDVLLPHDSVNTSRSRTAPAPPRIAGDNDFSGNPAALYQQDRSRLSALTSGASNERQSYPRTEPAHSPPSRKRRGLPGGPTGATKRFLGSRPQHGISHVGGERSTFTRASSPHLLTSGFLNRQKKPQPLHLLSDSRSSSHAHGRSSSSALLPTVPSLQPDPRMSQHRVRSISAPNHVSPSWHHRTSSTLPQTAKQKLVRKIAELVSELAALSRKNGAVTRYQQPGFLPLGSGSRLYAADDFLCDSSTLESGWFVAVAELEKQLSQAKIALDLAKTQHAAEKKSWGRSFEQNLVQHLASVESHYETKVRDAGLEVAAIAQLNAELRAEAAELRTMLQKSQQTMGLRVVVGDKAARKDVDSVAECLIVRQYSPSLQEVDTARHSHGSPPRRQPAKLEATPNTKAEEVVHLSPLAPPPVRDPQCIAITPPSLSGSSTVGRTGKKMSADDAATDSSGTKSRSQALRATVSVMTPPPTAPSPTTAWPGQSAPSPTERMPLTSQGSHRKYLELVGKDALADQLISARRELDIQKQVNEALQQGVFKNRRRKIHHKNI